ncbi:hypothetical protein FKM82_014505 [Ascaphus truei]
MPVSGQCAAWSAKGPLHHGLGSPGTGWGAEGGTGECPVATVEPCSAGSGLHYPLWPAQCTGQCRRTILPGQPLRTY